jgi:hypothetical protein
LSAILKPTAEASQLAAALGIQFDATALKTKGMSRASLPNSMPKGADTPEVLTQLFGSVEAVAAIAPSTGAGIKS